MDIHPLHSVNEDLTNQEEFRKLTKEIESSAYKEMIKKRLLDIVQKKNQQWTLWQSYLGGTCDEHMWGDFFAYYQENCQEIDKQQDSKEIHYSENGCRLCGKWCRKQVYSPWNQKPHGVSQTFQNCPNCNLVVKENEYRKVTIFLDNKPTEAHLAYLKRQQEEEEIKKIKIQNIFQDILANHKQDWVEYDSWDYEGSSSNWGRYFAKYDQNCLELQGTKGECGVCKREIGQITNVVNDDAFPLEYETFSNCINCKLAFTYQKFHWP